MTKYAPRILYEEFVLKYGNPAAEVPLVVDGEKIANQAVLHALAKEGYATPVLVCYTEEEHLPQMYVKLRVQTEEDWKQDKVRSLFGFGIERDGHLFFSVPNGRLDVCEDMAGWDALAIEMLTRAHELDLERRSIGPPEPPPKNYKVFMGPAISIG